MGGIGLEPVTPSLSRRPRRLRAIAAGSSFLSCATCSALDAHGVFAFGCALSRRLVVARAALPGFLGRGGEHLRGRGARPSSAASSPLHRGEKAWGNGLEVFGGQQ